MPLLLETRLARNTGGASFEAHQDERRRPEAQWAPTLEIGLVNNMPDSALRATEKQFIQLLGAATGETVVRLHLFSLPDLPRGSAALAHIQTSYRDLREFQNGRIDALIVTGSEPVAPSLVDEPYWRGLTQIIDWAEHNTVSTIWSCLAAHAAVLHLDGIGRRRLPAKRFGLFECEKTTGHPVLDSVPSRLRIPHSRWNGLDEGELQSHGYHVLTRSAEAGVDTFAKQWNSLFVFFQGHPEYASDTLFREYRRDMTRYIKGERDSVPGVPLHYFDARSEKALSSFAARAEARRVSEASVRLPECTLLDAAIEEWQSSAVQIYRNWLSYVARAKADREEAAARGG